MSETKKYLLRKATGDQPAESEQEIRDWFQRGQCKPADFLFDFSSKKWMRAGDLASLADLFAAKPAKNPEKKIVYFIPPGATAVPQGPYTTKELQARMQARELCESTWVFVEGDKEWRQVKAVKVLLDMLPALPTDQPAPPAEAPADAPPPVPAAAPASTPAAEDEMVIELGSGGAKSSSPTPAAPPPEEHVEREEATMAFSTLGLSLHVDHSAEATPDLPPPAPAAAAPAAPPSAPPAKKSGPVEFAEEPSVSLELDGPAVESAPPPTPAAPSAPPKAAGLPPGPPPVAKPPVPGATKTAIPVPGAVPPAKPAVPSAAPSGPPKPPGPPPGSPATAPAKNPPHEADTGSFDGITAQIPTDPIWLVKQANSEAVSGPFRFLEVIKYLEEGRLNKNDKISKVGTNRFVKIQQQYEFNVKYTLETVVENGVERQKILIKRRHPRVSYFTEVQIMTKQGQLAANCVNISAGGILLENAKAELNLGDTIEIKLLPGLINRAISCRSLIIGKIPKMPPAYALKFEELKQEDKEAIEFYVQETLKRES